MVGLTKAIAANLENADNEMFLPDFSELSWKSRSLKH